ncbi:hypothetical protein ACTQX1_08220 [Collinsella bouchesdurhonensis]
MITMVTKTGTYRGHTPWTIARRLHGTKAQIKWSTDPNNPERGTIVEKNGVNTYTVLGTILDITNADGTDWTINDRMAELKLDPEIDDAFFDTATGEEIIIH